MYALRDKVTEKLSNLFADSPIQTSSPHSSISNSSQAGPSSSAEKSLSSFFSFNNPLSRNESSESYTPLPIRRDSYDFEENGRLDNGEPQKPNQDKIVSSIGEHMQSVNSKDVESRASANSTNLPEESANRYSATKPMLDLTDDSVFISRDLYEFLLSSLPNIVKGCKWVLLYSTLSHGISLRTLIRRSTELSGPCLLLAGDKQGAVFGAVLECPLRPTHKRKYQGTNQTFVFTTIYGEPRIFRPTGANRYYWMCMDEFLAFGGGGNFALCLEEDLLKGSSGPCETFGNECLAHSSEFELKNVELWGFAHISQYLS